MITATELQTMRDALQRAIFSGTRRVQFTDRAVEYNSVDDMRKALADIDKAIATARIVTTPTVRIVLRKVLRTPRLMEPIATSSSTINLLSLTVSDGRRE